jgi:enhanced entry protein EnhC
MMKSPMPWFYLLAATHAGLVFADDGVHAYRQGDYEQASQQLSAGVKSDPIINYYMGRMTLYGYGQLKNNAQAMRYFTQAADRGFLPAVQLMGRYALLQDKNPEQALYWFKKAAEQGDLQAQMYCAAAYLFGLGVKPNADIAKRYYIAAARGGDAIAQCTLAQSFLETHQSANKKLGLLWLYKALNQNNPEAQVTLATLYMGTGKVLPVDLSKARELLGLAVAQGYVPALYQMGELFRQEGDVQSAKDWYLKAAEHHFAPAEMALSTLFMQEKSPLYDQKEGFLWMLKSAQNGSKDAQLALSDWYKRGIGVDADDNIAAEWLLKAKQSQQTPQTKAALWLTNGTSSDFSTTSYRLKGIFSPWNNTNALKENNYNPAPQMDTVTRESLFQPKFVMVNPNSIPISDYYDALMVTLAKEPTESLVFPRYPVATEEMASQFKQLEGQAVLGDSSAQYSLAQLYQQGIGVTKNITDAIRYYELAAAQQDLRAEYNLGVIYLEGHELQADYKKGFDLLQDAAFKGNAYAQYVLACIYEQGYLDASGKTAIAPNHDEALAMYGLAATNHFGLAQYRLAQILVHGDVNKLTLAAKQKRNHLIKHLYEGAVSEGITQAALPLAFFNAMDTDSKKQAQAFEVAKKEADAGRVDAAVLLGLLYDRGLSVTASQTDAVHWYEQASSNPIGAFLLGTHMSQGTGVDKNLEAGQALLQKAADAGFSYAHHNLAILQQQRGAPFLPELEQARELGNNTSGLLLADYYVSLANDPKQMTQARDIYQHIAESGDREGQLKLAYLFEQGLGGAVDAQLAQKWYTLAAEQGAPVAQYLLGHFYQLGGLEGSPNYPDAKKWYSTAQNAYAPAALALGFIHDTVEDDYDAAFKGYQRAAVAGDARGQFNTGLMYEEGKGRPVDRDKAIDLYLKAAEQGHAQAMVQLAGLYFSAGESQKAQHWYKKSADLGNRDALYHLGLLSETGIATKLDYANALQYYQQSSDKGDANATLALARMYQYGLGVSKTPSQALALYKELAKSGNPYAQYQLALHYLGETGNAQAREEGKRLLQQAQDNGSSDAQKTLQRLASQEQDKNSFIEPAHVSNHEPVIDKSPDVMYFDALNTWNQGDEASSRRIFAQILTQYPDYLPAKRVLEQLS